MIVGVVLVPRLSSRFRRDALVDWAVVIGGLSLLLLALSREILTASWRPGRCRSVWRSGWRVRLAAVLGVCNALVLVPSQTILQERSHEHIRARVYATFFTITSVVSFVPIFFAAAAADFFGVVTVLAAVALSCSSSSARTGWSAAGTCASQALRASADPASARSGSGAPSGLSSVWCRSRARGHGRGPVRRTGEADAACASGSVGSRSSRASRDRSSSARSWAASSGEKSGGDQNVELFSPVEPEHGADTVEDVATDASVARFQPAQGAVVDLGELRDLFLGQIRGRCGAAPASGPDLRWVRMRYEDQQMTWVRSIAGGGVTAGSVTNRATQARFEYCDGVRMVVSREGLEPSTN